MTGKVISLPTVINIVAKIIIAKRKLAIGPAETIIALWYKGLDDNNLERSLTSIFEILFGWDAALLSPKNLT